MRAAFLALFPLILAAGDITSFDADWRFSKSDATDAEKPEFD